jgi:hypothetical protein
MVDWFFLARLKRCLGRSIRFACSVWGRFCGNGGSFDHFSGAVTDSRRKIAPLLQLRGEAGAPLDYFGRGWRREETVLRYQIVPLPLAFGAVGGAAFCSKSGILRLPAVALPDREFFNSDPRTCMTDLYPVGHLVVGIARPARRVVRITALGRAEERSSAL